MSHALSSFSPAQAVIHADVIDGLNRLPNEAFQLIVADPPYGNVLTSTAWDTAWTSTEAYVEWTASWASLALQKLRPDGLFYVFGQVGQREHRWIFTSAQLCRMAAYHDQLIWDRVVGYNERRDSFTPQYEVCLVLRKTAEARPYFNKDAVRIPYDEATITRYLKDKRYQDREARRTHLTRGKFATNLLRVPSLKGASREKVGHPSQKPERLISILVESSSRPGDWVLDPFLGSGTTAVVCEQLERNWIGIERNAAYCEMSRTRLERRRKR